VDHFAKTADCRLAVKDDFTLAEILTATILTGFVMRLSFMQPIGERNYVSSELNLTKAKTSWAGGHALMT
jgi:hypothetical protein